MDLKTPTELLHEMLGISKSIIDLHGGRWTYGNGEPWDPKRTKGYGIGPCATTPESQQFKMDALGPAVDDPTAAVAKIRDEFAKRGFEVTNQFDSKFKNNRYIVFSMANKAGVQFVYKPGTGNTQLLVESGCSTEPAMDDYTK